jgi:hypothetical protein
MHLNSRSNLDASLKTLSEQIDEELSKNIFETFEVSTSERKKREKQDGDQG